MLSLYYQNRRMKILYLVTKSNWGGAQKYVYDLALSFAAKGHDVTVAFGGQGELARKLVDAGIRTVSIDSLARDINLTKELKSTLLLYRLIKKESPDIIHSNSSKAGGIGSLLGRFLGVPLVVVTIHGAPFREERSFMIRGLIYLFTWMTSLLAHKVIAVSKQEVLYLRGE